MEFNPNNPIIQLCMQGMAMLLQGQKEKATHLFLHAWNDASTDFEKFVAAYYMATNQQHVADKLSWLQTALQFAVTIDDFAAKGALPAIYNKMANCYEEMGNETDAANYRRLADSALKPEDPGPFYHGTKADMKAGDLLSAGYNSNYKDGLTMNHIYFTAMVKGAALAAELAKGEAPARVYIVQPTAEFENDPNVTDKMFPGNPTRSYRTASPLKVTGEVKDWVKLTPEELQKWRDRLAGNKGEIIN